MNVTFENATTSLNKKQINEINQGLFLVNILYSIKLKDLNIALGVKCQTAAMGRATLIILNHLNSYKRNIKNDLIQLYNLQGYTASRALNTLVENGLIICVGCKRKTNIGLFVTLDCYQITPKGRESLRNVSSIFDCINKKIELQHQKLMKV